MVFSLWLLPTTKSTRQKCMQINDNLDDHADAVVRCGAHRPMKHNQGFTHSQWMPPLGECSHRIAAEAAIVDDFGQKHKNTNNKLFLAS